MDPKVTQEAAAQPPTPSPQRAQLRRWAAGLSGTAALIHVLVIGEHFEEWWGYGVFFMLAALGQGFYALLLLMQPWRPSQYGDPNADPAKAERAFYQVGLLLNAALVLLYAWTRTVGIPFLGPEAGEVEPVTPLGLVSKGVEVALILVLVRLIRGIRLGKETASPSPPVEIV